LDVARTLYPVLTPSATTSANLGCNVGSPPVRCNSSTNKASRSILKVVARLSSGATVAGKNLAPFVPR
jgi:hypothetical protein